MIRRYVVALGLATAVVVLDAVTKRWAAIELQDNPIVIIDGFLELTYTENAGAAFGLFNNGGPVLGVAAIVVTAGLVWILRVDRPGIELVAFGLILGGAIGNLTNRIARGDGFLDGKVIDWVNLWWIPTFNVADAAITVAVGLLLIHSWLNR